MTTDRRPLSSGTLDPEELEERWFASETPTWRRPSPSGKTPSRPPSAPPAPIGDDDADPWFV